MGHLWQRRFSGESSKSLCGLILGCDRSYGNWVGGDDGSFGFACQRWGVISTSETPFDASVAGMMESVWFPTVHIRLTNGTHQATGSRRLDRW